ncbi:TonB C-terminal domain-containing protein [Undibacterium sp. Di26W]|uniref:cell envelope integrity protein TolA n=1 Tax=Undibacterium sp. Di26W TaxID=3413035 RepID=UPI003BF3EE27
MNQVSQQAYPGYHRHQSGQLRSIVLAALVHILLIGFLWIGIRWQNKESTAVVAEVWDLTTREAAPKPVIQPDPPPVVEKPIEPVPVKEEVRQEDPEIAIAQEKKRKLLEKKKEEELQRELAEKKRKEEQQEKLTEQKRKTEKLALEDADKKKQQAKDKLASDKLFKEQMQRMTNQAANTGSGGSGVVAKSTGNNRGDPSYIAKIAAKVRSNTNFSAIDSTAGNPTVEYRIDLLPDGSLRGAIRKLKSSGIPSFDEAVAKGIEKSAPFPRDKSGEVPPSLELVYRMKEE